MTTELDLLFTEIFHGYLDTAASRTAGVPAAASCALLKMDAETDEKDPRICIQVTVEGDSRSKQIDVIAVARGTAARSVTGPWLAAVGDRMADEKELLAYIATLPVEKRTGWQFENLSPPMPGKIAREENGTVESGIGVRLLITI